MTVLYQPKRLVCLLGRDVGVDVKAFDFYLLLMMFSLTVKVKRCSIKALRTSLLLSGPPYGFCSSTMKLIV